MRVFTVIPARGGSKGIKGKNLRTVGGVPLLYRAIRTARFAWLDHSHKLDVAIGQNLTANGELTVSTGLPIVSTDSPKIAAFALRCGAGVMKRPKKLATDTATTDDVLLDALKKLGEDARPWNSDDFLCVLQCTSPFTTSGDILDCLSKFGYPVTASAFTVTRFRKFLWAPTPHAPRGYEQPGPRPIVLKNAPGRVFRQDFPLQYTETGGVYMVRIPEFLRTGCRVCSPCAPVVVEPEWRGLDVDEPADLELADFYAARFDGQDTSGSTPRARRWSRGHGKRGAGDTWSRET